MGNSIGKLFTVTSFGESHGRCVGVVIDGCPAGLPLTVKEIQQAVDRRKPEATAYGNRTATRSTPSLPTRMLKWRGPPK